MDPRNPSQSSAAPTSAAQIPAAQDGWISLFDGKSTAAWRGYKSDSFPQGWSTVGGTLTKADSVDDIVTREEFGDFELEFEWKVAEGGNSGVFYRGTEEYDHIYWSAPEYQLLDDARHRDGKKRLTSAGSIFALYPSPAGIVKPANEWNLSRIIARGPHIEHWLNGKKVAEADEGTSDWDVRVKASKFKDWPNFGKYRRGYIAVQGDHHGSLSLRNIRIRPLS
jgi:hypothetical protein